MRVSGPKQTICIGEACEYFYNYQKYIKCPLGSLELTFLRLYRTLCGWHIRLALELIFAILMNGICPGLIQNCGICPVDAHDHKERQ
ncbi:hypothetical protein AAG906_000834 [Vitis piasezkii]